MKLIGIYKIQSVCKPNRIYIGSSININIRWKQHLNELKHNKHHSLKLQRHFNKYGTNDLVFSIIKECNETEILNIEQLYLNNHQPYFNICKNANNTIGYKHSKIIKQQISNSHKGLKHSIETKNMISKSHEGLKHSNETKNKIREKHIGKKSSEEAKQKLSKSMKKLVECEHCHKIINLTNHNRWHGNYCKFKN